MSGRRSARKTTRYAHRFVMGIPSGNFLKRQSDDDASKPRKRLKSNFDCPFFPEIVDESFLRTDFMDFAFTHQPDVLVTNGNVEFKAHKKVLAACSSVISDLFDGDSKIEELTLKTSNQAIKFIHDVIYSRPNSNERSYGYAINDEKLQLESLDLIAKWDFKIIRELLLENVRECYFDSAKSFERFFEKAKEVKEKVIADATTKSFLDDAYRIDLSGASETLLLKVIDHQKFIGVSTGFITNRNALILNLAKEVKRSGNERIMKKLKQKTKGIDGGIMCELLFKALC